METEIKSQVSGTVTSISAQAGNQVSAGQTIMKIK
ncbi:MAG: biotin/lipoyl-binding protein [bacterium]|nr:biotin/lipoyl-binding protein [bacterium]